MEIPNVIKFLPTKSVSTRPHKNLKPTPPLLKIAMIVE